MTAQSTGQPVPEWAKSLSSEDYFLREQTCLENVWTFLGFEADLANVDDWFRAKIGGRSIFVQRFKVGLRAFENICPHRFHPIRYTNKGNGRVRCDFHRWQFNSQGDAVGIPKCKQLYNKLPADIGARLNAVELSVCGGLIFGRFGGGPLLQEWLGEGYDILTHVMEGATLAGNIDFVVNTHWKYLMQISLDDYHAFSVHPTTFGKEGVMPAKYMQYHRFGAHSALTMGDPPLDIKAIKKACQEGSLKLPAEDYTIFQFFPTLLVASVQATRWLGDDYRYLLVEQLLPETHAKTHFYGWFFLMPFTRKASFVRRLARKLATPFVNAIFKKYMIRVTKEDNQVCENQQKVSHQINTDMRLSTHEERIAWFEEIYAQYVTSNIKQKDN